MLKRKLFISYETEDLKKIKEYFYKYGVEISLDEAEELWNDFSDSYSVGWLVIDEELLAQCFWQYVENAGLYYEYDEEKKCLVSK